MEILAANVHFYAQNTKEIFIFAKIKRDREHHMKTLLSDMFCVQVNDYSFKHKNNINVKISNDLDAPGSDANSSSL